MGRKSFLNPNFHNECFRLCAERHCFLHSMTRVLFYLLYGTKMTESKIHFTTACDKLMTSQSCDWVESNTVNPNFAFMPTGEHTEQKNYMWLHLKSVQSLARRSPMLFGLWKELCFTLNTILKVCSTVYISTNKDEPLEKHSRANDMCAFWLYTVH
jgi:hypothetical protein